MFQHPRRTCWTTDPDLILRCLWTVQDSFTKVDPVFRHQNGHVSMYAGDDPVNGSDPSGDAPNPYSTMCDAGYTACMIAVESAALRQRRHESIRLECDFFSDRCLQSADQC